MILKTLLGGWQSLTIRGADITQVSCNTKESSFGFMMNICGRIFPTCSRVNRTRSSSCILEELEIWQALMHMKQHKYRFHQPSFLKIFNTFPMDSPKLISSNTTKSFRKIWRLSCMNIGAGNSSCHRWAWYISLWKNVIMKLMIIICNT